MSNDLITSLGSKTRVLKFATNDTLGLVFVLFSFKNTFMKNPYDVLGVKKEASLDEIKTSYRRLAKKFHPDLNPGNKEAEIKFKEASHAFDQIGTEESKKKFDRGESEEFSWQGRDSFHETQNRGGRYSYSFGEDLGGDDFFENLFGRRTGAHSMDFPGQDVHYKMEIDFKEAAQGCEKVITLQNGKSLQVKIPAGIETGKKLKFRHMGEKGHGKGEQGDAYIEVLVRESSEFFRKGSDIEMELQLSFMDALLGAEVEVPTLEGKVMLQVPSGVSTGSKLRIKGKGAGSGDKRGDQLVKIKIVMPKKVEPGMKELAKNFKHQFNYDPRME